MKLSGYSRKYANEINLEEFFAQAQAFQDENETTLGKIQQVLLSFGRSHPWGVLRVRELMKFRDDGDYDKILRREMKLPEPPPPPAAKEDAPSSLSSTLSNVRFGNPLKK
jgi:dsDNA-specific endonuclease/ATPase MutS2